MSPTRSGGGAGRLVPVLLGLVVLAACAGPAAVSEPRLEEPAPVAAAPAPDAPAPETPVPEAIPLPTEEERAAAEKAMREAEEAARAFPEPARPAVPITVSAIAIRDVEPTGAVVVLSADGPFGGYESFSLAEPPRLIIDLPEATHGVKKPVAVPKEGPVKRLRATQYKVKPVKTLRLVVDLVSNLPYQVRTRNGQLHVLIGDAIGRAGVPEAPDPTGVPAAAVNGEGKVTAVTFKPAVGRSQILIRTEGRVSFNLTELRDPPKLILDVAEATIGAGVSRTLEVAQMPGPVERVRAAQFRTQPEKVVRVVADLKQRVRYEAVQSPAGITVELTEAGGAAPPVPAAAGEAGPAVPVLEEPPRAIPPAPGPAMPPVVPIFTPASPEPAPAPGATAYPAPRRARISMDFKDADINNLLRIIAEVSGQNIVAGDEVKGKVTVRLVDVEWEKALDTVLRINNFDYVWEENIIRVASRGKLELDAAARAKAALAIQDVKRSAPLKTAILYVNHAKPAEIVKALDKVKTPGRGSLSVDERTASLIIEDTEETIQKMRELLARLDVATPQITIEARLVEIQADHTRELGIEWGARFNPGFTGTGGDIGISDIFGAAAGSIATPTGLGTGFLSAASIPRVVNLPTTNTSGGIGITLGRADSRFVLGARLNLFETQGKSRTLSTPRITTLDNEEAEIRVGQQIPFTTVDSSGRTVVSFQEAFLRLKVTPHVTADKHVSMKVEAENTVAGTKIEFTGGFAFPLNQRKATTRMLVLSGSTAVIGGLVQTLENERDTYVPWLGRIPVLGWLFRNRSQNIEPTRTELLIFITPTLVEEIRQARR